MSLLSLMSLVESMLVCRGGDVRHRPADPPKSKAPNFPVSAMATPHRDLPLRGWHRVHLRIKLPSRYGLNIEYWVQDEYRPFLIFVSTGVLLLGQS